MNDGSARLRALAGEAGVVAYFCRVAGGSANVAAASVPDASVLSPQANAVVALTADVERATRHLALTNWELIAVECTDGVLALARGGDGTGVTVAPKTVPIGLVQRLAARVAADGAGAGE